MPQPSLDELATVARDLCGDRPRTILGIVGPPGAGKTAIARKLTNRLAAAGLATARIPMDGFHLADAALRERDLLDRKGAVETFDGHGYLALLRRVRAELDHDVLAPDFERELEQPLAAALTIGPTDRLVITEGNYLLDESEPWPDVRAEMAAVWFVDLDNDRRRARLVDRHVKFGKTRAEAQAWVDDVDEPNAARVMARRDAADLLIRE